MIQRELFDEPSYPDRPGYVRGSDTSEAAASSFDDVTVSSLRTAVFDFIERQGHAGATCDEVEVALGLRHQTASARVRELVLGYRIVDTGRRRSTRSGRSARVYEQLK